jgi:hypothetical protein
MNGTKIRNQNCWSFRTPYKNVKENIVIESIQPGYPNPGKGEEIKDAQAAERAKNSTRLCLETVKPIICPTRGGRQTKKRRIYRRKSINALSLSR